MISDTINKFRKQEAPSLKPKENTGWVKEPLRHFFLNDFEDDPRAPGFHPSQLYYLCPIQKAYALLFPEITVKTNPRPGELMTFAVGNAVHYWLQNRILGPAKMLIGDWKCLSCEDVTRGLMPDDCDCGRPRHTYQEMAVRDDSLDIIGHTDGVITDGNGGRAVLDIKTIKPNSYDALTEPYRSHIFQLTAYMHCLDVDKGVLLYVNKGEQHDRYAPDKMNVKEYEVDYDPGIWNQIEQKIGTIWRIQRTFEEEGRDGLLKLLPSLYGPCSHRNFWKAQDCPFADPCFKMRGK